MIEWFKEMFDCKSSYKRLWEEQNIILDKQKLRLHRKDKKIKKLELKIEKLENEITVLKARRASKKSKRYNCTKNNKKEPRKAKK